jgi:hypothetical protein
MSTEFKIGKAILNYLLTVFINFVLFTAEPAIPDGYEENAEAGFIPGLLVHKGGVCV